MNERKGCGSELIAMSALIFLVAIVLSSRESAAGINWAVKIPGDVGMVGAISLGGEKYIHRIHYPYGLENSRHSISLGLCSIDGAFIIGTGRDIPDSALDWNFADKSTP